MGTLEGRTALVTGGASGMGLATTRLLAAEGARVLATGRTPGVLAAARESVPEGAVFERSDAASLDDIEVLAQRVEQLFGRLDLLHLNAGIAQDAPFERVTAAMWDEQLAINVRGPFFAAQRLAPLLKDGGSIVLTTSIADVQGLPELSVYAASKAALRSLARSLARELAPRVRVNAVSPGPIETPILDRFGRDEVEKEQHRRRTAEANPSGRWGRSEEIARAVLFLAFEATFTTGHELPVDGGLSQL